MESAGGHGGGGSVGGGGGGGGGFRGGGNINNSSIRRSGNSSNIDMLMLPPPPPHSHPHHQHLMASSSSSSPPPSNAELIHALFHPLSSSSSPSAASNQNDYQSHKNVHNTSTATAATTHHLMMFDNTAVNNNNNKNASGSAAAAGCYFMKNNNSNCCFRDKIMAHPHYPRLLAAYINCQKVGAPPEVVDKLEKVMRTSHEATTGAFLSNGGGGGGARGCIGEDPALDQFMEAYCEMLIKYEQELTKPFKEAMLFFSTMESQLKGLSIAASSSDSAGRNVSSEEEFEATEDFIDPRAEDRELKVKLLRKYSGYLGSLKQEFMKKRKKGKLPKEARQQLLDWWSRHYKWPYPSESQKLALAESTGLDQKQINNWFINQRKRHWKPSEEMQFMVMDHSLHPQYYVDNVMANPFPMNYCAPSSMM